MYGSRKLSSYSDGTGMPSRLTGMAAPKTEEAAAKATETTEKIWNMATATTVKEG